MGQTQIRDQAERLFNAGEFAAAAEIYARLAKRNPKDAGLVGQLGTIQMHLGKGTDAVKNLTKAARLDRKSVGILHNLAVAYRTTGRIDEALKSVETGLRIEPKNEDLLATKADFLRMKGDDAAAWKIVSKVLHEDNVSVELVLGFAPLCARNGHSTRGIELLKPLVERQSLSVNRRREVCFRLGELLDGAGRFDEAFEAFVRGNSFIRSHHDPAQFTADTSRVIDEWSATETDNQPRSSVPSDPPVFVVGMPRSGTSLVEQILASHSNVEAGGELPNMMGTAGELTGAMGGIPFCPAPGRLSKQSLDRIARNYLRDLKKVGPIADRVTDKNPLNFLYLGMIDRALPGAQVIHCVREPMDTCLSCFFTDFAGGVAVAADLGHLGSMYRDYERLMSHWKDVVQVSVLEVRYEDLVSDIEGQARRIVEHVGLSWQDACTRFHETDRIAFTASVEQVRKPIYVTSVARHKNYLSHLEPLAAALNA